MSENDLSGWKFLERPGFAGKKRDIMEQERDRLYGAGNWRIAHEVEGKYYSWLDSVINFYEEAYYHYLKDNPEILNWLCKEAKDVYDNAISNVESGLDYLKQENSSNHMQDISIRRVVKRLGRNFEGNKLIKIRGRDSKGSHLSPGVVPFHRPEWIKQPELDGWWKRGSIESFWQSNKVLLVKK